jgi:hypothetical protein
MRADATRHSLNRNQLGSEFDVITRVISEIFRLKACLSFPTPTFRTKLRVPWLCPSGLFLLSEEIRPPAFLNFLLPLFIPLCHTPTSCSYSQSLEESSHLQQLGTSCHVTPIPLIITALNRCSACTLVKVGYCKEVERREWDREIDFKHNVFAYDYQRVRGPALRNIALATNCQDIAILGGGRGFVCRPIKCRFMAISHT